MTPKQEVVQNDLMDLKEACMYIKYSRSAMYKMTATNSIPFMTREGSSKILFSRIALNDWNSNTTTGPYNLKVDEYLHKNLRVRKEQKN